MRDYFMYSRLLAIASLALLIFLDSPSHAATGEILLQSENAWVAINPVTMACRFQATGRPIVELSAAMESPLAVSNLEQKAAAAEWSLPEIAIKVRIELEKDILSVHFRAEKAGSFTWPRIVDRSIKAWILPIDAGTFVPSGDPKWIKHLVERGALDTTADLCLPFWGLQYDDQTISVVLSNPYNNGLKFENIDAKLCGSLAHEFTSTQKSKAYSVQFRAGGTSTIEAARHYREWLIAHGEFLSLTEKIRRTPEVGKLVGAAHIYLWGQNILAIEDVLDWRGFARKLSEQGNLPSERFWNLLRSDAKKLLADIAVSPGRVDRYSVSVIIEALNEVLSLSDLYKKDIWEDISLDPGVRELAKRSNLNAAELCRVNSALLFSAFPQQLASPENWGDGVSSKMIQQLADAGFDRLWLGSDGWGGFARRPETVELAKKLGYLIGPYDSYHSIHLPGMPDTWETAQFDADLYERGAIVLPNGQKRTGFKRKGHLLSPLVAQPYVEERVTKLMGTFRANSWFIDCDGFGQYFDDYSEVHPASQSDDAAARVKRMAWIRDCFGVVIGSEGCSSPVASTIHFAHGVMTPVIGWSDSDMKNKASPYFVGGYYPPGEPAVFFKSVPLKEAYQYLHFDPRFRVPLFSAVFHDSVIATHHWTAGSLKFRDTAKRNQLFELLYGVPPLWHLNVAEFRRNGKGLKRYYDFFSRVHRLIATLLLTDFDWMTPDGMVQRTRFGDHIEILANFGVTEFLHEGERLPGCSVVVRQLDGGSRHYYSPE